MPRPFVPEFFMNAAPTVFNFIMNVAPVEIITGPVGSGKTTGLCIKGMKWAMEQEPSPHDGYRRFKMAMVRNTTIELKRTTAQTWLSCFPEDATGPLKTSAPMVHRIRREPKDWNKSLAWDDPRQGTPGLDFQVDFMGLDNPKDVRELLSYEGTVIAFNELKEIPKNIVDKATERVGRYPSMLQGGVLPTKFSVWGDTNPPDEDHYLYQWDQGVDENGEYIGRPEGYVFYFQAPGVIEMTRKDANTWVNVDDEPITLVTKKERYIHRAAGSLWAVNPAAENLPNLPNDLIIDPSNDPLGPGGYYARALAGKDRSHIRGYLQGRYGFIREGKPVIPEFDPVLMVVDDLPTLDTDVSGGIDMGGNTLNPAAVFHQRHPAGAWLIHGEVIGRDMGIERFTIAMKLAFAEVFPTRKIEESQFSGDPAGITKDPLYEFTAFEHFRRHGITVFAAPTNDTRTRIDAIKAPMGRMINGKPGILIHRRCKNLIKGLSGAWQYRRKMISGTQKFQEKPDKDHPYSDICEALGYGLSGGGETHAARTGSAPGASRGWTGGGHKADTEFDALTV